MHRFRHFRHIRQICRKCRLCRPRPGRGAAGAAHTPVRGVPPAAAGCRLIGQDHELFAPCRLGGDQRQPRRHLRRAALVFGSRRRHGRAALVGLRPSGEAPTPLPIRSWPVSPPAWLEADLKEGNMGVDLRGGGRDLHLGWPAWSYCLDVAEAFGWQPEGTRPAAWVNSDGSPCEEMNSRYADWNGSYMSNEYRTVTDSDAHALAAALARAIGALAVDARLSSEQLMVLAGREQRSRPGTSWGRYSPKARVAPYTRRRPP